MTNENSTLVHEGVNYRKVNRKANVGEKVLITDPDHPFSSVGVVKFVYEKDGDVSVDIGDELSYYPFVEGVNYLVLEPVEDSLTLTELTESDVRNNPRQVIDLIANLAGRLTKAESTIERLDKRIDDEAFLSDEWADEIDDRIDRLASANEQAINSVARNVETWAQEHESLKRKVADINDRTQPYQQAHELFVKIAGGMNGRQLTDEERREL